MSVPYASATSGERARSEITRHACCSGSGASPVGFMDEFAEGRLLLAFRWRGQSVQLRASARGWADLFLKENPWHSRRRYTKAEWHAKALDQGMIAVNSILRDWVRDKITAIETGIVELRQVFLPYLVTATGETVAELVDRRGNQILELPE